MNAWQSMFNYGGPASRNIGQLTNFVFLLFLVVTLVMFVLIAYFSLHKRGSLDEHEPVDAGGGHSFVLIGGLAIPAAILAIVFVTGLKDMSAFPLHDGPHHHPNIRIAGHQWWWDVQYIFEDPSLLVRTANEIHVPVGRPVDIELDSSDVIHSFWVPELHGKVDLVPGQKNLIRIEASRAGTFRGQCAEYCGAQHAHMALLVVADSPDRYEQWLVSERATALAPQTDEQQTGLNLFQSRACLLCHTVRGTMAQSRVGPDLTHIGGRMRIAANIYDNDTANLSAWVTHAQSMKPGVLMPNITNFTGSELRALVAYLQHLK